MGMDFCWSGSASYGRFLKEMGEIAKIFGAQVRETTEGAQYYVYYEPIPEVVVGWLDCPYDYFPPQRTKAIWEAVRQHPEIEEISWQIWNELEKCVEFESGWYIH